MRPTLLLVISCDSPMMRKTPRNLKISTLKNMPIESYIDHGICTKVPKETPIVVNTKPSKMAPTNSKVLDVRC